MKTKLFIAILMITSITFAQKKNQINTKSTIESPVLIKKVDTINTNRDVSFMQIKDVKDDTNKKSNETTINRNNKNNNDKISEKREIDEQLLNNQQNKIQQTRRRVVVLKRSN